MSEPNLPLSVDGPFQGMLANSRVDAPPGFLSFLQNFIVRDSELEPRPGILAMGSPIGGGADVQGIYQWEMLSGLAYTCAFANGDLYTFDWTAGTWTLHDLGAAGLTVSTSSDINCATSRGRLILTDGVNKPCMITGILDGIGETFTQLANAPIAHRVGLYYDKVFFWDLPGAENQIEWSDEGDPVNGYSADNQAWEFAQTDAGKILGCAPLNERMNILKEDSATVLLGSADEDFSTLAVREGLSETEGCVAGGSVVILNGDVFLLSQNGPRRIKQGQVWQSLHDAGGVDYLRDLWADVDKNTMDNSLGWTDRAEKHVGFLVPQTGSADLNVALVFNEENTSWTTFKFEGFAFTAVGSVEDTSGKEWVLFGDEDGVVYKYRVGFDQLSDNGTAIEYRARRRISDGTHMKKRLTECAFLFSLDTDLQGEIGSYVDGVEGNARVFGLYDQTGEKRYRRGFNECGYELGWWLKVQKVGQRVTIQKVTAMSTAVELSDDWDG